MSQNVDAPTQAATTDLTAQSLWVCTCADADVGVWYAVNVALTFSLIFGFLPAALLTQGYVQIGKSGDAIACTCSEAALFAVTMLSDRDSPHLNC